MPEDQLYSEEYKQGFNEGYLIARHLPELSDKLAQIKSEEPRMEGFRDGHKQFIQEKTKSRTPEWLKKGFSRNDKAKGKEDKGIEKV